MAEPTFSFDPARYLGSDEERAAYLTEALETNDPDVIADALEVVARSRGDERSCDIADGPPLDLGRLLHSMHALGLRLVARPG